MSVTVVRPGSGTEVVSKGDLQTASLLTNGSEIDAIESVTLIGSEVLTNELNCSSVEITFDEVGIGGRPGSEVKF